MKALPSPKKLLKFLKWFCKPEYHPDIEGDLLELYERKREKHGEEKARWALLKEIILLMRPGIIRSLKNSQTLNHNGMYQNYLKVACRNLFRQKRYTVINIGGLAIGIACFVAIFLYVTHELSYDRHFDNIDRIYRVYTHEKSGEEYLGSAYYATIPLPLAEAMMTEFPEITHLTSMEEHDVLLGNERHHYLENGLWVDTRFFDVFSFRFLQGNPSTALSHPESIVLTRSLASKLFGNDDPIGKNLTRQIRQDIKVFTVSGIIEDPPANTTFRFSFLAPLQSHIYYRNSWDTSNAHTFLVLSKGATAEAIASKMPDLLKKYQKESLWTNYHQEAYLLQPFREYHLENQVNNDIGLKGNPRLVSTFSVIAVLVLLLACINYMNLAIARSMNRAREVGLRKAIGAVRRQLIWQFLGESILLSFVALLVAFLLLAIFLPVFAGLIERPIEVDLFENRLLLPGLGLLVLTVGLLSGSYPAFFISGLRPVQVLKGKLTNISMGRRFQRILITGQYAVSIVMIICSLVIYAQFHFMQQREIGYDREHIITMRLHDFPSLEKYRVMKSTWSNNPNIIQVTASGHLPTNITSNSVINYEEGNTDNPLVIYRTNITDDFLAVYGIELVAGKDVSPASADAKNTLLLNEKACQALGWQPDEAIGKHIKHRGTVIGVVKDFHMLPLKHGIEPLMLRMSDQAWLEYISVKISPEDIPGTLSLLESTIKQYSNFPFEYSFLDDEFDRRYKADLTMGKTVGFFTILSILIASIGLFGLVVLALDQRTREIGIRKVMGASTLSLVSTLSQDFLRLVIFGFLAAIPIAWYLTDWWLNDYAYSIDISWWMFALPAFAVFTLAFLTISSQSIKAAMSNPVECLRQE
ncbi:ABC transporter permease [Fulvivirgaceae bacterium BMA12]|uniref:ABC transporter permease n=1 Tax=Agaribacillus aureus TaxID=3051825 RepID=A0ABT8L492_9BACT|nr:ABC transporter permease [Fulvivirgaceae bacterium BMA12]